MEGFYSKREAARILGVSVRQIGNYLQDEKVRRAVNGRQVWIPKEDVERLYNGVRGQVPAGAEEFQQLQSRVADLEHTIEILKLGLGFGRRGRARNNAELMMMRQRCIDLLSKVSWKSPRMMELADELMRIQDAELATLVKAVGPTAWVPLVELATRMLSFVEMQPEFPEKGLEVLHTRLLRGRDRFYGLLHAATKTTSALPPPQAHATVRSSELQVGMIDSHIVAYVTGAVRSPWK